MTGRSGAGRGGRGRGRGRGRQGRRRRSLRRACAGARVRRLAALQQSSSEDARARGGAPPERLMPRTRGSSTPPKPKLPATDNPSRGVPPPRRARRAPGAPAGTHRRMRTSGSRRAAACVCRAWARGTAATRPARRPPRRSLPPWRRRGGGARRQTAPCWTVALQLPLLPLRSDLTFLSTFWKKKKRHRSGRRHTVRAPIQYHLTQTIGARLLGGDSESDSESDSRSRGRGARESESESRSRGRGES